MRYLFYRPDKLSKYLEKKVIIFLDYDGTLTPIVATPDKAVLSQETRSVLEELSASEQCKLIIVSGRALKDIKAMVGIPGITYVGNHGLEIEGAKIKFESLISLRLKNILGHIRDDLQKKILSMKGAFVEDKGLSLSLHYRLASKNNVPKIKNILEKTLQPYLVRKKIKINTGKKVFEIKPCVDWDKGKVVLWLLARQQFILGAKDIFPIYIGDDITDEDAFRALKNKGLTIFVGSHKKSSAQHYLKNTGEVMQFLRLIIGMKRRQDKCLC